MRKYGNRNWLFSANEIKSSESVSKQPTQLILAAENIHKCLLYLIQIFGAEQFKLAHLDDSVSFLAVSLISSGI